MKIPPQTFSKAFRVLTVLALIAAPVFAALPKQQAYAAGLGDRSLRLESVGANGGSAPSLAVNHVYSFVLPTASNVGSVVFQYCDKAGTTAAFPACTAPTGVSTTGVGFNTTGLPGTPVTWNSATASDTDPVNTVDNAVILSKSSPVPLGANTTIDVRLTGITNPSATNTSFFVWITSYDGTGGTGNVVDEGTVTASTARPIVLTGKMPESLIFCTGSIIPATGGGLPDCPNAASGAVAFNKLFDPTDTASATSQMAASTNATDGYVITVNGPTLANGTPDIDAIGGTPTDSIHGVAQFGLNLVANTPRGGPFVDDVDAVGADVDDPPNGTNLKGQAFTNYNANQQWAFQSGDPVAKSDNGGAGPSDIQKFTVSYMVNVPGSQPAGTYTTTLTYICTAYF